MQPEDCVKWGLKDDKWDLSLMRQRAISIERNVTCCVTEIV